LIGYAGKRLWWREQERALAEARLLDPYEDLDLRSKDFIKGCEPRKFKEGKRKFNKPHIEKKKRITDVTMASKSGAFSPC
jgi:hypothetical protein